MDHVASLLVLAGLMTQQRLQGCCAEAAHHRELRKEEKKEGEGGVGRRLGEGEERWKERKTQGDTVTVDAEGRSCHGDSLPVGWKGRAAGAALPSGLCSLR